MTDTSREMRDQIAHMNADERHARMRELAEAIVHHEIVEWRSSSQAAEELAELVLALPEGN